MKKVVKAVFIISFFTFLDRVLGFAFKIYLSDRLGVEAIGIYQVSLSFFFVLLAVVTSGIPLVTSKLTAKFRLSNDLKKESSLSAAALICSTVLSLSLCALILIFSKPIGKLFADERSSVVLLLLLPALVFSAIYSALRGNLWGRQKYLVSSVLELVEQIARISVCVILFAVGFDKLKSTALSLTIGCLISMIICAVCYFVSGARLANPKGNFKLLIKSSAGVSAARASTSAVNGVVAILAPALLMLSGLKKEQAMYEFGYAVGMALPLIYVPLTVVGSLSYVMIPSLAKAAEGASDLSKNSSVRRQIEGAIKSSIVLGVLFFPLFYALGQPIGMFIYKSGGADAGAFLSRCAWLLIPISIESITSSMLNPLDLEMRGLLHYLIGAGAMLLICAIFFNRFSMDVLSVGMGVGWSVSSVLNIALMRKRIKISFSFIFTLLLSVGLAIPTVYLTKWIYNILYSLPAFFRIALSGGFGIFFLIALDFLFGLLKLEYFISKKSGEKSKVKKRSKKIKA